MSNYILIGAKGANNSVHKAVFGDIADNDSPNIKFLYTDNITGPLRVVQRIITSKKLNRFIKMPLSTHWEVNYRNVKPLLSEMEKNYIIFVPGVQLFDRVMPSLIRSLRKKP